MSLQFNAPPGWPQPSPSWVPGPAWLPDPGWPAPPRDWTFWTVAGEAVPGEIAPGEAVPGEAVPGEAVPGEPPRPSGTTYGTTYGTDRAQWLASLGARAVADVGAQRAAAREPGPVDVAPAGLASASHAGP